tara:strand:+ start:2697 stop:3815 length:1119 start_codon:yes stop_codon:yes gene_type:complete
MDKILVLQLPNQLNQQASVNTLSIKSLILGSSGYVGSELIRLIEMHPDYELTSVVSESHSCKKVSDVFPHLFLTKKNQIFDNFESYLNNIDAGDNIAIFSAAPHGKSALLISRVLSELSNKASEIRVVDSSADFRFSSKEEFKKIYGFDHPKPDLLKYFVSGAPELININQEKYAAHPGCFATAVSLSIAPLVNSNIVTNEFFINAVTGSTGSGKRPKENTHHPERHSNYFAYKALAHRHAPEIESHIKTRTTQNVKVNFVPCSGPFSRGIYSTCFAKLTQPFSKNEVISLYRDFYSKSIFIRIKNDPPRIKDIVSSNYCDLSFSVNGYDLVITAAIDNLIKGAAGGSIQLMNKLWGLDDCRGLQSSSVPWT